MVTRSILSFILCTTLVMNGDYGFSQGVELVPNGGFEEHRCTSWYISSMEACREWTNPTMNSPDYFNNSCPDKKFEKIPSSYYGGQKMYNGQAYAGIIACYDHKKLKLEDPGAEYIQVKLVNPLEAGKTYSVKADFSLAECSRAAVKEIGFYFSASEVKTRSVAMLKFPPSVVSNCDLKDTSKWVTSIQQYTAVGNEQYLIIGSFNHKKLPEVVKVNPSPAILDTRDYAYYFIDNVSVQLFSEGR